MPTVLRPAVTLLVWLGLALQAHASATAGAASLTDTASSTVTVAPFTFEIGPYELQQLPPESLPLNRNSLLPSCSLTDANGVAMYRDPSGVLWDHPVAQSGCALKMLSNYRISPDRRYLEIAITNARHLLERAVTHQGALFFPYPFEYVNRGRSTMKAPWYSALAQGHALTTFVRLFERTSDPTWLLAADATFSSFKVQRASGSPWVADVEQGLLWLDEYPTVPLDRVFNGHNYGLYGLYDYWRVTGNPEARLLTLGALHSSYRATITRVRVPGGVSQYCVSDRCMASKVRNPTYHLTHTEQLTALFHMTAHWHFADVAEAFTADSPRSRSGRAWLDPGIHEAHAFDAAGVTTQLVRVNVNSGISVAFDRREVPSSVATPGRGIWLRVAEGQLAGLWVRESSTAWPLGFVDSLAFAWKRIVLVENSTYQAAHYLQDGTVLDTSSSTTQAAKWTYTDYARINGRPAVKLASGPLADRWLMLDGRMVRDSTNFADVADTPFRADIIWLSSKGITHGCGEFQFCPEAEVSRAQLAVFLERGMRGRDFRPPAAKGNVFLDVGTQDFAASYIEKIHLDGITEGCGGNKYCPNATVSRAQMAVFLLRAKYGSDYSPPLATGLFADVPLNYWAVRWIEQLAREGITVGCGGGNYCSEAPVMRDQMAAFFVRTFGF